MPKLGYQPGRDQARTSFRSHTQRGVKNTPCRLPRASIPPSPCRIDAGIQALPPKGGVMKHPPTTLLAGVVLILVLVHSSSAQILPPGRPSISKRHLIENAEATTATVQPAAPSAPRGYARYTAKDWRRLIDSTWGPGLGTAQKLQIFDDFWSKVDRTHGGFVNNNLNWDSLRSLYRPEIAQGVSRGRFGAIISHMSAALREAHTSIYDDGMDSALVKAGKFRPRGVPILIIGGVGWGGLGASLTPLPDSSLLVLQSQSGHPFGLAPGDIVVGYDRVPWKKLVKQLIDAQLPIDWGDSSIWGSSSESCSHFLLTSVTINWHLFDSLDVVKYPSGDTVHLATSVLDTRGWDKFNAVEQIPIKGVPFPVAGVSPCTGGVVDGTNVGYIFIRDWYSNGIEKRISAVIDSLTRILKVHGLIVDFRNNSGGDETLLASLGALFNDDPYRWYSNANRASTTDRTAFSIAPTGFMITPKDQLFDHPIAVLTGPGCFSTGDVGAFFMRSHPMVRFFGKPTNMAYVVEVSSGSYPGNIWYTLSGGSIYSHYHGESYLIHKGFDVDEKVWFTRDDAAKGDDTIVKRALEWIAGLAYAHDAVLSKVSAKPGQDSVRITTTVENPLKHTLNVWSYVTDSRGHLADSCQMFDDGLHGDGAEGDKIFGGSFGVPAKEGVFGVSPRTTDVTAGTYRHLTNAKRFFTNGPVVSKGWASTTADTIPNPGDVLRLKFRVASIGKVDTVRAITATVSALDTLVSIGTVTQLTYGDLAPGQETLGSSIQTLTIKSTCPPNSKGRLLLTISSYGITVWTDTVSIIIQALVTEVADNKTLPTEYSLSQNYPNPFNPTTSFDFQVPGLEFVSLKVFDVLGREVATLVDEIKQVGEYKVTWDASKMASGIYFYRLQARPTNGGQAGAFVETKKMMLIK
jgi:hypothetical protein